MKNLLLATCAVFSHVALADVCIPHEFAVEGVSANYEKITEEERIKLADVQKEYAELMQVVQDKKGTSNQLEILNAFVDAAGMIFILHSMMGQRPDLQKKIKDAKRAGDSETFNKAVMEYHDSVMNKPFSKETLPESFLKIVDDARDGDLSVSQKIKNFFKRRIEVFKAWTKDLKAISSWGGKAKEMLFFSMKKIGFVSAIAAMPLGAYIWMSRLKEEQRMTKLTGKQDKVMKQALMFDVFVNQKSFAELAATRAKMHPERVCPPAT